MRGKTTTSGNEGDREIDLVPVAELAECLWVLRHALITVRIYWVNQGAKEARMCGFIADALHNLLELLLNDARFDEDGFGGKRTHGAT